MNNFSKLMATASEEERELIEAGFKAVCSLGFSTTDQAPKDLTGCPDAQFLSHLSPAEQENILIARGREVLQRALAKLSPNDQLDSLEPDSDPFPVSSSHEPAAVDLDLDFLLK